VERILNAIYEPTTQKSLNLEEAATIVFAMDSFEAIINNEAFDGEKLFASSVVLRNRYVLKSSFSICKDLISEFL
jgi:hypothetical protein